MFKLTTAQTNLDNSQNRFNYLKRKYAILLKYQVKHNTENVNMSIFKAKRDIKELLVDINCYLIEITRIQSEELEPLPF